MGRREVITGRWGMIVEVTVHESTEIAQLISNGILVRTDRECLDAGWGFVMQHDLNNGSINAGKSRIPDECADDCWIDASWSRSYETENDYS